MDAEPVKHWIDDAKCGDPFGIGCTWSGRIWIIRDDEGDPFWNCMSCPNCGGNSFTMRLPVVRSNWMVKISGWTA